MKVVAHCRETRKSFEPYIYKEYLAYKTYNLLTDQSFRVRLAHVEYLDTRNPEKTKTFAAFLIEHVNDFAKRNAAKKVKDRYILPSLYDENALCLAELFQYFVGNCDFSFFASADECCHNGKVFAAEKGKGVYIPVPYDFDMTGLVNVPYAKVNPKLPIKSVTDRYYRGVKASDEIFQETINLFIMKKVEILSLWESSDLLPMKDKKEALDFINEFYSIIEDPIRLENNILKKMRGRDRLEELMIERIENLD